MKKKTVANLAKFRGLFNKWEKKSFKLAQDLILISHEIGMAFLYMAMTPQYFS
jgi:hypothetical protein